MGDHSPLMFESEDDDVETEENKSNRKEDKENYSEEVLLESPTKKIVDRLRHVLAGVPPPPTVTFLQMDANHLLDLWNKTNHLLDLQNLSGRKTDQLEKDLSTKIWPCSTLDSHFGIYYNRSCACEQLEALNMKYQERYVGNETSSSVNALAARSPPKTASAKKRARRLLWGHSPGRRLSHLARRRNTFSSIDLRQPGPSNNKKMILVNKLKTSSRKKLRNSVSKNPAQSDINSSSSSKAGVIPKRALFQSPENGKKQSKTPVQSSQRTKRALFSKDNSQMPVLTRQDTVKTESTSKRQRESDLMIQKNAENKRRCTRSLHFEENEKVSSPPLLTAQTLSKLHRQKLLWAVSGALREKGIKIKDSLFQPCASQLFVQCKTIWLEEYATKSKEITSTSDKMLEIVKRFCSDTVAKVQAKMEKAGKGKPIEMNKPLQVLPQNVLDNSSLKTETDFGSKRSSGCNLSLSIGFKNSDNKNESDSKTDCVLNLS